MAKLFTDRENTLFLIDISAFIFRAFYAIRMLSNRNGEPTNAVYGVATMLARLAEEADPSYLAVVYDSKEPSFRKTMYSEYKANRSAPPEDLLPQFDRIEDLIARFEIGSYRQSGVEADDLIATLTKRWIAESPAHQVVVVSGDKDLMALVGDRVQMWDTLTGKVYDSLAVVEKFGIGPEQIRDYLSLVGDSSDNIPGVPSIGPKSAVELLKTYGPLEKILEAAREGKIIGKKGDTLREHEPEAIISQKLATLLCDLDVDLPRERVKYHFHVTPHCIELLRELDFHSLVKKWENLGAIPGTSQIVPTQTTSMSYVVSTESTEISFDTDAVTPIQTPSLPRIPDDPNRFRAIRTESELKEALLKIAEVGEFGFDLETTSLNPREAKPVGVALCYDRSFAVYIPVGHTDGTAQLSPEFVLQSLKPILENPKIKKIGQNLKYDMSCLAEWGVHLDGIGADTMVAAYVLAPEGRHNLETLASRYLGYGMLTYEDVCGKGKTQISFADVPTDVAIKYSAEDAWIAVKLWDHLRVELEKEVLMEVFATVDLPLVSVLSRMELNGVCIDADWLAEVSKKFEAELLNIQSEIGKHTSSVVNLNSPKQLAVLLFEELKLPTQTKTKTGFSTDASVLEALSSLHEVPRLLLEHREIAKLKGTYVDPLPLLKDKKTGKIHAGFHQAVTATGRLSSSDPNLQNIPVKSERGRMIRRAFIPSPGNILIAADYSQIELRILAHMSEDAELVRSFVNDEDVHRRTASEIFSVPTELIDDRQRGIAKAINFGLMYGKTAFGLSQELSIPRKEAQLMIERYFERYNGVKRFLDRQIADAKQRGYVLTMLGRKRALPEIHSKNAMMRAMAERMAMNTPIQGTAADLMKLAMIELDEALTREKLQAKLIIQVHDEVVLDCPREEEAVVIQLVTKVLEGAMKMKVPLRVNVASGVNWEEI